MLENREMNMCEGSILKKLILYSLPLMATNILQLLFNAADVAVLGAFRGDAPVAAVGSTAALINLIIGLFVGLSVGANVLIARCVGENNEKRARRIVGMSMLISVAIGIVLAIVGVVFAKTFLTWMACPDGVIDLATKYLQIYFLGMPIMLLYNFCASILRAVGDTVRPLIYLVVSGVVNVGLNVFFVAVLSKDVEGVAIATITAQTISAILSVIALLKGKGFAKLELRRIKIYPKELVMMIKIGLPAGVQGCLFSLSNVLIQSSINSFGDLVVAGNSIAMQLDGFIFNAMNAVSLSSLAFVSQNLGANNYERIKKTLGCAIGLVVAVGIIVSAIIMAISPLVCSFIADSEAVIEYALIRVYMIATTYFLCGIMDVLSNSLRGLGLSSLAMCLTLIGTCLLRVVYVWTVLVWYRSLYVLYAVYPISYVISIIMFAIAYIPAMKKIKRQTEERKNPMLSI
ncbi:MAG: MATE family efflux transporter [Clostridiales bacterium]|nr:MATE family efflux transporter [Clostridiales bacterium]